MPKLLGDHDAMRKSGYEVFGSFFELSHLLRAHMF